MVGVMVPEISMKSVEPYQRRAQTAGSCWAFCERYVIKRLPLPMLQVLYLSRLKIGEPGGPSIDESDGPGCSGATERGPSLNPASRSR